MIKTRLIFLLLLLSLNIYSQENKEIGKYIFTLAENVRFPRENKKTSFSIAIFGKNSDVYKYLKTVYKTKKIHYLPVSITNVNRVSDLDNHYDIIYVDQSKNRLINNIYKKIHKTGTLLITYKYDNKDYYMINILEPGVKFQIQTSNLFDEGIVPNENLVAIGGTKIDLQGLYEKKVALLNKREEELELKQQSLDSISKIVEQQRIANIKTSNLLDKKNKELLDKETELKKKEKTLKEQNIKINAQNNIILIITFFVIILIILSIIIYKALKKNKEMNAKLVQQNEEIIQQKEEIQTQSSEILKQRDLAIRRGKELEAKNNDINASIEYALNIQRALLPEKTLFEKYLDSYFIYYKPRDIVSGDFYWTALKNNKLYIVAADCTGHGVPGAFMSMLGISFLDDIITMPNIVDTNQILNELRNKVIFSLKQSYSDYSKASDGMDLAMIRLDFTTYEVQYSGAYNSLHIVSEKEPGLIEDVNFRLEEKENSKTKLYEIRADRMPIGTYIKENIPFTNKTLKLHKGDNLYIFSDGYNDMFSEKTGTKFGNKRFKQFLLEINNLPMEKQFEKIAKNEKEWCGNNKQIDDILIIGMKIK